MKIDILTLFPGMFEGPMNQSMMWKAQDRGLLTLKTHDIRDHAYNKHRAVDDTPYGGGGGMILRSDVVVPAIEAVTQQQPDVPVILMSPQGRVFNHDVAVELAQHDQLVFVCGHYEGFDERIRELAITDEISIGDYVLTGGELAAMVIVDAVVRHIPGVLGAEGAENRDSHADGLLEGPHYTRPAEFRGLSVPKVLQNGNHGEIERWRRAQSLRRTWENRPELLLDATLMEEEQYLLAKFSAQD